VTLRTTDPAVATVVLDKMRRCISWIDVGLVTNDVFIPLLFNIAMPPGSMPQLATTTVGCLSIVESKRMDQWRRWNC
jgi:exportin-T